MLLRCDATGAPGPSHCDACHRLGCHILVVTVETLACDTVRVRVQERNAPARQMQGRIVAENNDRTLRVDVGRGDVPRLIDAGKRHLTKPFGFDVDLVRFG